MTRFSRVFLPPFVTLALVGMLGLTQFQTPAASGNESILLGSPELTGGIPGTGKLTTEQIEAWLAKPETLEPFEPILPPGLSAAQANVVVPADNPMSRGKIELGRQLYFDTRLSADNTISCASCHHPEDGFGRKTRFGVGVRKQEGGRNSPVSFNRIVSGPQFWDGRAASLEEQAIGPIANPIEMGNSHEETVKTIQGIEGYRVQFAKIFPQEGITIQAIGKAIATFERALVTGPAPYDSLEFKSQLELNLDAEELAALKEDDPELNEKYLAAKKATENLSASAVLGKEIFFGEKGKCTACHAGANFTDEKYHNLGVGMGVEKPDLGRFEISKLPQDTGAFKTPTVRNIIFSPPYMHDGSQKTLEEVVDWYNQGGHANPYLSDKVKKLNLTDAEKKALVDFMKEGLTSDFPKVETGRLPE